MKSDAELVLGPDELAKTVGLVSSDEGLLLAQND